MITDKKFRNEIYSEIKNTILKESDATPDIALNLSSNLCWLRYVRQVEFVIANVKEGGKLLDIGCGYGHTTAMIASTRPDLDVTGFDLRVTQSWNKLKKYNARFEVQNVLEMPFKNEEINYCTSFGVIEHTNDEVKFLSETNRILKKNGLLFIFNLPNRYALFEHLASIFGVHDHDCTYNLSKITSLLTSTGFRIEFVRREFFLPSQPALVSKKFNGFYNSNFRLADQVDRVTNILFNWFSQSYEILASKL